MTTNEAIRPKLFDLIRARSFGRDKVMLASGRESDFYFDMKPTMLHPFGAAALAALSLGELQSVTVDSVGGLELGAVPIAVAIVQASHTTENPLSAFIVRKQTKEHGAKKLIEGLAKGESIAGRHVAVLEDVTTTGGSALQAVDVLREAGAHIALILTMVDRQEGAEAAFRDAKLPFRALFKAEEFLKG